MPGETSGEVRLAAQEIDAAFSGRLKTPGYRNQVRNDSEQEIFGAGSTR